MENCRKTADVAENTNTPSLKKLLIVDDEPQIRRMLARLLSRRFHDVYTTGDWEEAERILSDHAITHLLVDHNLGPAAPTGEYLIIHWRRKHPDIQRALLITGTRMSHVSFPVEIDRYLSKVDDPAFLYQALKV